MKRSRVFNAIAPVLLGLGVVGFCVAAETPALPGWIFPQDEPLPPGPPPRDDTLKTLPGSSRSFTLTEINSQMNPADWRPELHPPMPQVVAHGREPLVRACASCHLPNGQGRPENSSLAGQSRDYLLRQLDDFKNGARISSNPPTNRMVVIAKAATESELEDAARYFSGIGYRPWIKVVESDTAPHTRVIQRMSLPVEGPAEPLGRRIVETTQDLERNELRDPAVGFVAYVPRGSIEAGEVLAKTGADRTVACVACHGETLKGAGDIPSLAGRSPIYIARQLYDFQHGARHGSKSDQMQPVTARLTEDDIIDLAAYAGSLAP
jgi:cytochrome c553